MLAVFDEGASVAGVFTRSKCPSAPVEWCRARLKGARARALVVNSGNANAFTGKSGREACAFTAKLAAAAVGCKTTEVFLASTGVIGEPLPAQAFDGVLAKLATEATASGYTDAAGAIMTTDTFPKLATAQARLGGTTVTINGFAKGAGMIAPDMATMLAFVFTDAPIAAPALQTLLREGVVDTFNAVTIDGDTSTSDTLLAFATGAARGAPRIVRAARSAPPAVPQGVQRRARQSRRASGARRRGRAQAGRDRGRRRGIEIFGAPHRAVDRQFAAGQDRDRRRGRQLGPRGHGGRQSRRARRPRPAVDLVQRHPRRAQGRARSGL